MPQKLPNLSIGGVDARCADQAPHRYARQPRRERETKRDAGSALINAQPSRNWETRPLADPTGNQRLLRHDPCRLVSINLEYDRVFSARDVDTVDIIGAAMKP